MKAYQSKKRIACIREVQNSIKDSVRQLLSDKISKFGLSSFFTIKDTEIVGKNGSVIIFKGMQHYNADNIKSLEGFDIAWVEEAQSFSERSLRLLRPTMRKEDSELWFSWNPRHDSDAVDKFFRQQQRRNLACVEINWRDNPWFPNILLEEMNDDYANDQDMAEHVWEGGYEIITEAAYYAKHVKKCEQEGRIGYHPYNPNLRLRTGWDIGVDDHTAVWFIQDDGKFAYVVDYYETSGDGAQQIVPACMPECSLDPIERSAGLLELEREIPFKYDRHFFPHDVRVREWGAGARTRVHTLKSLGVGPISHGIAVKPEERINAVRALFPILYFNDIPRVQAGIKRLRRYSRKFNQSLGIYEGPLKDGNDHGSDALGEWAINCGIWEKPKEIAKTKRTNYKQISSVPRGSEDWRL